MDTKKEDPPLEKVAPLDQPRGLSSSNSLDLIEAGGFDLRATKKLVRKLDWHLIPFLSLIYLYVWRRLITKWEFIDFET
jgi:hypothetical protein